MTSQTFLIFALSALLTLTVVYFRAVVSTYREDLRQMRLRNAKLNIQINQHAVVEKGGSEAKVAGIIERQSHAAGVSQ